jgi:hypothetical protein
MFLGMSDLVQQLADAQPLVQQDPHELPDLALLTSTETLMQLVNQLQAVITARGQVIDIRDATVAEYGRQTRGWLTEEMQLSTQDATRQLTVARALPTCPSIGAALHAGAINLEHARVIAIAVRDTPAEIRDVVEKELVTAAETTPPSELARFARELRGRLGADESTEAAAQRRYESRWVRLTPTFDGMHAIDGMLDPASAATLHAALTPLLLPGGEHDPRSHPQRLADGLVTLAETALAAGRLPEHGGEKPHVVVTIDWASLHAQLDADPTATSMVSISGQPITPATARMIACDAAIIPAILGGDNEVLNLGRRQPTWSTAQRRALRLQDTGCRFPGCRAGLDRCQIHHITHWAHGGATDLANAVHLCRFHHWLIHHTNWQISKDSHNHIQVWRT